MPSFGYPSSEPCRICDEHKDNQSEPRFGYTVCTRHRFVPPAFLDQARAEYQKTGTIKPKKLVLENNQTLWKDA